MQKRSRAPGAGRKPKGEITGKSATLTTRIREDTRAGLDRAAKANGRSLSQEVEVRLRDSLEAPDKLDRLLGTGAGRGLALIAAHMANTLESRAGASWRDSPWVAQALFAGLGMVAARLSPQGDVAAPDWIAQAAGQMPAMSDLTNPATMGAAMALGIIEQIHTMDRPPMDGPTTQHHADEFKLMPAIRRHLGIEKETTR